MASTSRTEPPPLWCFACSRLHRGVQDQDDAGGNGCASCGNPAAALEAVVDVVDSRAFLDGCHTDAAAAEQPPTVTLRDAGRDCAVCMEELAPGSAALVTPCGHAFHPRCVAPWLEARGTCPLCRTRVGGSGDRDGLVMCRFHGGRIGLGRRVAGRVFNVRVLDADGNLERPRAPRGVKRMLRMSARAMLRRDRFFRDLQHEFVS